MNYMKGLLPRDSIAYRIFWDMDFGLDLRKKGLLYKNLNNPLILGVYLKPGLNFRIGNGIGTFLRASFGFTHESGQFVQEGEFFDDNITKFNNGFLSFGVEFGFKIRKRIGKNISLFPFILGSFNGHTSIVDNPHYVSGIGYTDWFYVFHPRIGVNIALHLK